MRDTGNKPVLCYRESEEREDRCSGGRVVGRKGLIQSQGFVCMVMDVLLRRLRGQSECRIKKAGVHHSTLSACAGCSLYCSY